MSDDLIKTIDMFEAAFVSMETKEVPEIVPISNRKGQCYFVYPRTEQVIDAVKKYALGDSGIHSFINSYKFVRKELYRTIGGIS